MLLKQVMSAVNRKLSILCNYDILSQVSYWLEYHLLRYYKFRLDEDLKEIKYQSNKLAFYMDKQNIHPDILLDILGGLGFVNDVGLQKQVDEPYYLKLISVCDNDYECYLKYQGNTIDISDDLKFVYVYECWLAQRVYQRDLSNYSIENIIPSLIDIYVMKDLDIFIDKRGKMFGMVKDNYINDTEQGNNYKIYKCDNCGMPMLEALCEYEPTLLHVYCDNCGLSKTITNYHNN